MPITCHWSIVSKLWTIHRDGISSGVGTPRAWRASLLRDKGQTAIDLDTVRGAHSGVKGHLALCWLPLWLVTYGLPGGVPQELKSAALGGLKRGGGQKGHLVGPRSLMKDPSL